MGCSTPGFSVLHYLHSLLKFIFIELVMLSKYLILCWPLHLLPSIYLGINRYLWNIISKHCRIHIVVKVHLDRSNSRPQNKPQQTYKKLYQLFFFFVPEHGSIKLKINYRKEMGKHTNVESKQHATKELWV